MSQFIAFVTMTWVCVLIGSLQTHFLADFFASSDPTKSLGIDFWSVPRGFLNLLDGKSMFDTFGGSRFGGPYVTWYLSHPIFIITAAPLFSFSMPIISFYSWTITNICILLLMGNLFAKRVRTPNSKMACYFLSVFGFPVFSLLYTGNIHTFTVIAFALIFLGFHLLGQNNPKGRRYFILGTLLSLFTKPIVFLMLPMFLLLPQTRKSTVWMLVIYFAVSFALVAVPIFNPESVGWRRIVELILDPKYVKEHLNIYVNHFVINAEMKDNIIHWLNLIAQSDFSWNHLQIFSLSAFLNGIFETTINPLYFKIPLALALICSILTPLISNRILRIEAAKWIVALLCLSFFLSYNTVWEYQFTLLIPISLLCVVIKYERGPSLFLNLVLTACLIVALPSLYYLFGPEISVEQFAFPRMTRVIPTLLLYCLIFCRVVGIFFTRTKASTC